jgi:AraC-like DNA-binding protein
VDRLADEVGWSRKRLSARFRSQLGITPKRAARLVRFDHAAHLLAVGRNAADVAAESGYVDQPHLHREVKSFTGLTPTAVAVAPWLAIDEVAWPASSPLGGRRHLARRTTLTPTEVTGSPRRGWVGSVILVGLLVGHTDALPVTILAAVVSTVITGVPPWRPDVPPFQGS